MICSFSYGVCDNPQIESHMQILSDRLSKTGGKKVYGYLKPDVKAIVDSIVDELSKDEYVADCYIRWQNLRNEIIATYSRKPQKSLSLSAQKEFKSVKNVVIREALALGVFSFDEIAPEQDSTQAQFYFANAFDGFVDMETERADDKLQCRIGQMLHDGVGTEKNEEDALKYFERSAALGNPHAQYALAKMIIEGGGDAEKITEAIGWLSKSADSGNQFAQYTLGKLYLDGESVAKDIPKAVGLMTLSAEQGNPFAQYQLGKLHLLDSDIPRDREQAVHWFMLSAALGNEYAQFFLEYTDEFRDPSLLFSATQLLRGLAKLFEDQQQQQTAQSNHIDRKRMRELREKQQAQGHAQDEQIQSY